MSMYEIEALIENTIRVINKGERPDSQKRNLIWNAFKLQNNFDCSFTHFRLMDILLKNKYVQTFEPKDFPLFDTYPDFFKDLNDKDFEWINKHPNKAWSKINDSIAYWDRQSGKIYADYGTPYYSLFPDEKCKKIKPLDFGLQMIVAADKHQDMANIYDWTAFMIFYLLDYFPTTKSLEELKQGYFDEIKSIVKQYDYSGYKPLHRGMNLGVNIENDWLSDTQKALLHFVRG